MVVPVHSVHKQRITQNGRRTTRHARIVVSARIVHAVVPPRSVPALRIANCGGIEGQNVINNAWRNSCRRIPPPEVAVFPLIVLLMIMGKIGEQRIPPPSLTALFPVIVLLTMVGEEALQGRSHRRCRTPRSRGSHY